MITTPILEDDIVLLTPLLPRHFEQLFEVASDPVLWEFHPMSKGYEKEVFKGFFKKALDIGSLLIVDKTTGRTIGCTRFYNYNEAESSVVIGQTFYAKAYWGTGYNTRVKVLMLEYAFRFVQKIIFLVHVKNFRSGKAVEKLGAAAKREISLDFEDKVMKCVVYEVTNKDYKQKERLFF